MELERPRVAVEVLLLERLARRCEVAEARAVQVDWVGAHLLRLRARVRVGVGVGLGLGLRLGLGLGSGFG